MEGDVAHLPDSTGPPGPRPAAAVRPAEGGAGTASTAAAHAVTALYRSHALGLTRLAFLMLGDRHAAEDVVQEAFCGLFRAWDRLPDDANVLGYLRVSVVNGCRSVLRRSRRAPRALAAPPAPSAEADVLVGEEKREAVAALRRLPPRRREALVLRYFAELPENETAKAMGVSRGTVKSTTARGLAALGRMLREEGTALEERLRGDLGAESEIITPESIAPLRLPGDTEHVPRMPRRGVPRHWPEWVKPLVAAAAAAAVIAGTFAIAHALPGTRQQPWSPTPPYAGVPRYYAYTLQGDIFDYTSHGTHYSASVGGRYLRIRATGSGKLMTVLAPPKPYNNFQMISADATGTVFVLGAMHDWQRYANSRPSVFARTQATPIRFLGVRITGGRARVFSLHLPVTVTPGQGPSMALSPDGARLALAYGGRGRPAVVDVITLPDGRIRHWTSPRVPWSPLLSERGAWTADGRTLVLQEEYVPPARTRSALHQYHPPTGATVRLIGTAAPGSSLAAGKLLVLRAPAGEAAPQQVFITPDGTKLIGGTGQAQFRPRNGIERGALSVYSAWTGALLQRLAPWKWNNNDNRPAHGGFPQEQVAWSNPPGSQLIVLHPVDDRNILGSLTGGTFRTAGPPLPRQAAGYQELQNALRTGTRLVW